MLSEVRVKLDLIHERILDEAIKKKFFKTKNDAINAGILLLWKKHRGKASLKNYPKKDPAWEEIKAGFESIKRGKITEWKYPFK